MKQLSDKQRRIVIKCFVGVLSMNIIAHGADLDISTIEEIIRAAMRTQTKEGA